MDRLFLKICAVLIVIAYLLPVVEFAGYGFKLDLPILFLATPIVLIGQSALLKTKILQKFILVFIGAFSLMFFTDTLGTYVYSGKISLRFPSEAVQVFSRVFVFILFFIVASKKILSQNNFIWLISFTFILGLIFGLFQFLDIFNAREISLEYYALTENQHAGFSSLNFRGFGTSGNILTWGGLSIISFYFFYFVANGRLLKITGSMLSVINILFTLSRGALISLLLSFVLILIIQELSKQKAVFIKVMRLTALMVILVGLVAVLVYFFEERYTLLITRMESLGSELSSTGRASQLNDFFRVFSPTLLTFIFGVGKPEMDNFGLLEVEPFYYLATHGIVLTAMLYSLVYFTLKYSNSYLKRYDKNHHQFILATTFAMLLFSSGYYFLREIYSGMIFWILTGYLLGKGFRNRNLQSNSKTNIDDERVAHH